MANDRDRVFASDVVGDNLDSDAINPVVVDALVLTSDAMPVDSAAIVLQVVEDNVLLAVDQRLEQEVILTFAANQNVVRGKRLVHPIDQLQQLEIDGRIREGARRFSQNQLPGAIFASVGAAEKDVIAKAADQQVRPAPAINRVVAVAAQNDVVAVTAMDFVVAAIAVKRVVAAFAFDRICSAPASKGVIRYNQWVWPGRVGQRSAGAAVDQLVDFRLAENISGFIPAPDAKA